MSACLLASNVFLGLAWTFFYGALAVLLRFLPGELLQSSLVGCSICAADAGDGA